jgi:outer membrane biogenesis lipoprotein LolB
MLFLFAGGADVVLYFMRFGLIGLASLVCLMLAGCATTQYATLAAAAIQRTFQDQTDSHMWREQLERQQKIAREAGRIGYIGNAGPALGTSFGGVSLN